MRKSKMKIFELEENFMECWNVVDDIRTIYDYVGDDELFESLEPEQRDKICNLLLGIKELYSVKFERTFKTLEGAVGDYHDMRKTVKALSNKPEPVLGNTVLGNDPDWNEARMDIIGQNGNDGEHYEKLY